MRVPVHFRTSRFPKLIVLLVAGVLAGCRDDVNPTAATPDPAVSAASRNAAGGADPLILPGEVEFHELAQRFPSFAGYHYDRATGDVVALMKDTTQAEAVRAALAPRAVEMRSGSARAQRGGGRVRVRPARFAFEELRVWRDNLTPRLFSMPSVRGIDLDEAENRVWVGVESASSRGEVMRVAAALGVPSSALVVEPTAEICPAQSGGGCDPCTTNPDALECQGNPDPCVTNPDAPECQPPADAEPPTYEETNGCPSGVSCNTAPGDPTVRDTWPFKVGGLLINRYRFTIGGTKYVSGCTLGFNTTYNGRRAFVTNAHCTAQTGVLDLSAFYQKRINSTDSLGSEIADPPHNVSYDPYSYSFCPSGNTCRYSDAAVIGYSDHITFFPATIIQPTYWNGSIKINQANPYFYIRGENAGRPVQYRDMDKVGATTGWTYGQTIRTCYHARAANTSFMYLCQAQVQSYTTSKIVESGDSGSPVFYWTGSNDVSLYGLLWGKQNNGTIFLFSPLENIRRDFPAYITSL
jgi:hypothetical protein